MLDAVILGLVEGLTEFLPVSSTGHMILASSLLGIAQTEFLKSFEIAIQLGAIAAVVLVYWRRVWENRSLATKVIVAFIPTAIIGLIFYRFAKTYLLGNTVVVLWALFLGGIVLIVFERWYRRREVAGATFNDLSYGQAALVGTAQALAIIPGVSRSAATILGGLALGLNRESVVQFSFLLAVPTIGAATLLDLTKTGFNFTLGEWQLLAIGFVVAFATARITISWLIDYIRRHDFTIFGVYRIVIALVLWWFI
jgi:undecaprenyl-diphosphatase